MATKTKIAPKAKPKSKPAKKTAAVSKTASKKVVASKTAQKKRPAAQPAEKKKTLEAKPASAPVQKAEKISPPAKPLPTAVKRAPNLALERRRLKKPVVPQRSSSQFSFMKAPGAEYEFEVGDIVEVFCDHEKNRDRIRGWVKGIIVQVDHKLAAVQFRSNVYLTDGWMVPDRILWFPVNSEHIRPVAGKKSAEKKNVIPDY